MKNKTEMPVEVWVSGDKWEKDWSPTQIPGDTSYTRTDTIPDVTELQRQNTVLKALFRKLFDEASWTVYDTIQNEAREGGVIILHEVTQEDIDDVRFDNSECALGDTVYVMSDWMQNAAAKIPIPSRAEVAREYLDACEAKLGKILNNTIPFDPNRSLLQQAREDTLKEWEDAESK